ncbi:MAG TPA: hypothetical protein VF177_12170 [Anaerolineae bacterium]
MTTFVQFCTRAKVRHDFSDMIQVRYSHHGGEDFDTWVSGEEVMARLKTMSREQLIQSFSRMNWQEAKEALEREVESGKKRAHDHLLGRLADAVSDNIGGNIFGDTLADKIRGVDSAADRRHEEKQLWHRRLQNDAFRAVVLELAWINLEGSFPGESVDEPDDWV